MNEQVLLGSLLGDGHIETRTTGYHRYKEAHSIKQMEYAIYKAQALGFKTFIRKHSIKNPISEIHIEGSCPLLKEIYPFFYRQKIKRVMKQILNKLTPKGVAIWYCDDGTYSYSQDRCRIASCHFTQTENGLLKEYFGKKWNVSCSVKTMLGYRYLDFNPENTQKLINLISPYVPPCMSYKLGIDKVKSFLAKDKGRKSSLNYYYRNREEVNRKRNSKRKSRNTESVPKVEK